jgi:hypothetical protein
MSKPNSQVVALADGRRVCLSYGTVVAIYHPAIGYRRTDKRISRTSSIHANRFAGLDSVRMPHDELVALAAPLESRL